MVAVATAFALGTLVYLAYPRAPFWQVVIYQSTGICLIPISLSVTNYSPCNKMTVSLGLAFGWLISYWLNFFHVVIVIVVWDCIGCGRDADFDALA